ncbi:MAG TPA: Flp pilus assembly protein CpaB [Sphingomonas sp.]|jgi:pilus assembly protein CpaB
MDSRKVLLLAGALSVAGVTAFFARTLIAGSASPEANAAPISTVAVVDGPEVLVATRSLPVGTILDATSLKYQPWPKELVDNAYFLKDKTDLKSLAGTVVRNAITAGQPVTQGALVKPGDRGFLAAALGPGMRAVTVAVSQNTGVAGFVFPGDRIDLMLTQSFEAKANGDERQFRVAETVVRNIRVLATDQRTDNTADADGKTPVTTFNNVTLEATPKIAEQIAVAQQLGTISLSLRSLADNSSELEQAIASGAISVPEGKNPKVEQQMLLKVAREPQTGASTFATGGDVSRFARRSMPVIPTTQSYSSYARPSFSGDGPVVVGPVVRVSRGNTMTEVPVGGKK